MKSNSQPHLIFLENPFYYHSLVYVRLAGSSSYLRFRGKILHQFPLSQCAPNTPAFHPAWINHPAVRSSKRRNFHLPPAPSSLSSPITVSTLCWETSNWPQEAVLRTRQATSHAFVVDNIRYHDQTQWTLSVTKREPRWNFDFKVNCATAEQVHRKGRKEVLWYGLKKN